MNYSFVGRSRVALSSGLIGARRSSLGRRPVPRAVTHPHRRFFLSTVADSSATTTDAPPPPSRSQLQAVFIRAAVPMIGFGIMDQTVMLQAGHALDCTIGVTFGLSTLTAAAMGQVCSDASGVLFGNSLERLAHKAGLPQAHLTLAQKELPAVQRTKLLGTLLGVITGCCIGLLNLLLIDTDRSSSLKLQAFNEQQEFEFQIEASNAERENATTLTVTGPDVDGVLASMTAALALQGCSLVELHAKRSGDGIKDFFYVVNRETSEPFEDDDLEELAKTLLDSTRTPMNLVGVKSQLKELERLNANLRDRVRKLEQVVVDKQIRIVPRTV